MILDGDMDTVTIRQDSCSRSVVIGGKSGVDASVKYIVHN